jgi:ComF family protein
VGWRRVVFSSTGDLTRADRVEDQRKRNPIALILETAAASVFSTLFPSDCRFCRTPLVKASRLPVCDICLNEIQKIEGPVCSVCGQPIISALLQNQEKPCCGDCLSSEPLFSRAVAYGPYDGGLRELIHLLKYDRVRPAANVLGRMMSEAFLELASGFDDGEPLIIPVPLHSSRLNQRGFNQSELIARAALKLVPLGRLSSDILRRTRATETQIGFTREQRQRNIRGAFRVQHRNLISGRDILLVDDVFTTGTTVSECARTLRRAGANRVFVATVARVLLAQNTGSPLRVEEFETQDAALLAWAARA